MGSVERSYFDSIINNAVSTGIKEGSKRDSSKNIMNSIKDVKNESEKKTIFPTPGHIVKTKRDVSNSKVFINICSSEETLKLYIAPAQVTLDKAGRDSAVYTCIIDSANYEAGKYHNERLSLHYVLGIIIIIIIIYIYI